MDTQRSLGNNYCFVAIESSNEDGQKSSCLLDVVYPAAYHDYHISVNTFS